MVILQELPKENVMSNFGVAKCLKSCHIQVWPLDVEDKESRGAIEDGLRKAKEAAERQSGVLIQRSSSGTGEKLRANFAVLLDEILEQDSHLLSKEELGIIQAYKVISRPP